MGHRVHTEGNVHLALTYFNVTAVILGFLEALLALIRTRIFGK
jgi:hypothetical protein